MNWFRQNRFLGIFAVSTAVATIAAFVLLMMARGSWNAATERLQQDTTELTRLQSLAPFPSAENLRKMKAHADDYAASVAKLQEELKSRMTPVAPIAPNEFQARLRAAVTSVGDRARSTKTKLPENFFLGFDQFASALPNTAAAPLLGQQLVQVEMLTNILLDAHVDAVTALHRSPLPEESGGAAATVPASPAGAKKPGVAGTTPAKLVERSVIDMTFTSTPAAARHVINAIAAADHQFFVIRLLDVRNEKDKGPSREVVADPSANAAPPAAPSVGAAGPQAAAKAPGGLSFIVGNERLQTSARIEIVRFNF